MVETLITVIIIIAGFGLIFWVMAKYVTIPQPWFGLLMLAIALIALLIILRQVGVVTV
jgi:hypothetical protein